MSTLFPESMGMLVIDCPDDNSILIPFKQDIPSAIEKAREVNGRLRQRIGGSLATTDPTVGYQVIADFTNSHSGTRPR